MSKLQLAPLTSQGNPMGETRTGSLGHVIPSLDDVEESSDEHALSDFESDDEGEDKPTHHWKYIGEESKKGYLAAVAALPMSRPWKCQTNDEFRSLIEHCLATVDDRFLTRNRDLAKWIVKVEGPNLTPWKRPWSHFMACNKCRI
jgi:hypothetical protein